MNTTPTKTVISMIIDVIEDGDNTNDILDKIINKYPEYIDKKVVQRGSNDLGIDQARAEISSRVHTSEGVHFVCDRNTKPHQYSLIVRDDIDDSNNDDNNNNNIIDANINNDDIGYVYIINTHLYNADGDLIVKIGKANDIDKRMNQLNREHLCVMDHEIMHLYHVERPYKVEHAIHDILDKGRISPNRELFRWSYIKDNLDIIEKMVDVLRV